MSIQKNRKLLDEVRDYMPLHPYSIHTGRTYCDWIKKFVQFHDMKSRNDLYHHGQGSLDRNWMGFYKESTDQKGPAYNVTPLPF